MWLKRTQERALEPFLGKFRTGAPATLGKLADRVSEIVGKQRLFDHNSARKAWLTTYLKAREGFAGAGDEMAVLHNGTIIGEARVKIDGPIARKSAFVLGADEGHWLRINLPGR